MSGNKSLLNGGAAGELGGAGGARAPEQHGGHQPGHRQRRRLTGEIARRGEGILDWIGSSKRLWIAFRMVSLHGGRGGADRAVFIWRWSEGMSEVTRPETRCGASSGRGHVVTRAPLWRVLLSRAFFFFLFFPARRGRHAKSNHFRASAAICSKVQEGLPILPTCVHCAAACIHFFFDTW